MESYKEMRERQQQEVNAFPFGFAFSNEQFEEMMKKIPLDDGDKYYSIGAGGYVRGKDIPAMEAMFKRHKAEKQALKKASKKMYDGFIYELYNHEYIYSEDDATVLGIFGYTVNDLETDKELARIYGKAVSDYMKKAVKFA